MSFSNLTIYTITYNEESILPHFINWYRERFFNCKIIVYDNHSTDNTAMIALRNNCYVFKYDSGGKIRDDIYLQIKNNSWKTALTDWVLVCDCDEFLDIKYEELLELERQGITTVKTEGYSAYNLSNVEGFENAIHFIRDDWYDKTILFNKKFITEINYDPGCHYCEPIGELRVSEKKFNLFHYHFLGVNYTINRYKRNLSRLSEINKVNDWGNQYNKTTEMIIEQYEEVRNFFNYQKSD